MNINMKYAKLAAASISFGTLLTVTACTDYAEEFKDEYKDAYGEVIVDNFETPFFSFDSANVIWQGYNKKDFNSTTSSGAAPFATSDGSTQAEYRGRDNNNKNYTTNSLPDDVTNLVRRSGGIAGKLIKNSESSSFIQIIFPTGDKIDYSDASKVSGIAVAMASEYKNTEVCLLSISEDKSRIYKQYCATISDKFGKDSTVYAAKVSIKDIELSSGSKNFGTFLPTANAIGIKISGKEEASFGFNIVGVGTYYDGSSTSVTTSSATASSSESKDDDEKVSSAAEGSESTDKESSSSNVAVKQSSSSKTVASSSSTAIKQSSSSKTVVSSSSEVVSSSSAKDVFYWTGEDGIYTTYDSFNLNWILEGEYTPIWTVPVEYVREDVATTFSIIVNNVCKGMCTEVAPMRKDTAMLSLDMGIVNASDWNGVCVTYTNAGADIDLKLKGSSGSIISTKLESTETTESYKVWDFSWADFNGSASTKESIVKSLNSILFNISNDNSTTYNYFNIYEVGQKGTCTAKTEHPQKPTFSIIDTTFFWKPYDCDTCTNKNSIMMLFDGDTVFSKWESSNPETDKFSSSIPPLTIEQAINKQDGINTFIDSTNNPKFFFKLNEDGSSRDITDWQGICVYYNWRRNIRGINTTAMSYANLTIENGEEHYAVTLPSYPAIYASKCFRFDEFFITDKTVKATKISISFARADNQAEDVFALLGIGEYKTMNIVPFVDNIVDGCLADRSTILVGDSAKWHLELSTLYDMSVENPSYNWMLLNATKLSGETSSFFVSEKEGSITSTVTVSLDDRGIYQQLYCPTVTAYPIYTSCKYYVETSKIGYGSIQLIDLENEYGRLPDSLVSITWKDASEDETKGYFAKVNLDNYSTVYVPTAYIEYYNGVKDTIVCDTMKTGEMPQMETCVLSTSLEETAAKPGTEVCWTLSNEANVPAAIISSITFNEDIDTQNGAKACKTLGDYGKDYQPTVDIQYTDGTIEKLTCELVNVPELKSTDFLNSEKKYEELTDERDGRVYKTIQIGNQIWMAENLDYKNFEKTPSLSGNIECGLNFEGQEKCNSAFATNYRWNALEDACPTGWRIPSEADFLQLIKTVGNDDANAVKLLSAHESIKMNQGTNETGFSAIPNSFEKNAKFWSNTIASNGHAIGLVIASTQFMTSVIFDPSDDVGAVRCIKIQDKSFYDETEQTLLDYRDGQLYKTTTIENQVWLAQNLRYVYVDDNKKAVQNRAYSTNQDSIERYGRHYAWAAAVDSLEQFSSTGKGCGRSVSCNFDEKKVRGICPAGWHLPDTTEFQQIITSVGGYSDIRALKATESYTEQGQNGTNKSGFNAYAAGQFNYMSVNTNANMYSATYLWTTAEDNDVLSAARTQPSTTSPKNYAAVYWFNSGSQKTKMRGLLKSYLYSVRCLKD